MVKRFYELCDAAIKAAHQKNSEEALNRLLDAHCVAEDICKIARRRLELGRAQEIADHFVGVSQNCIFIISDTKHGKYRSAYLREGNILSSPEPERLFKSSLRRIQREIPPSEEKYLPFAWPNFRYLSTSN